VAPPGDGDDMASEGRTWAASGTGRDTIVADREARSERGRAAAGSMAGDSILEAAAAAAVVVAAAAVAVVAELDGCPAEDSGSWRRRAQASRETPDQAFWSASRERGYRNY
jgi:hypothetical protein